MNSKNQELIPPPQSPVRTLRPPSNAKKDDTNLSINFMNLELDPQKIINDHFHQDRKQRAALKLQKMYRYPAEYYLAQYHQRSNKLGLSQQWIQFQGKQRRIPPCPCCQNFLITNEIPLCYRTYLHEPTQGEDKFILPLSISIYFTFVKMVIFLLILRFLLFDLYVAYSSTFGNFCASLYKKQGNVCAITISGYNLKGVSNQSELNIIDILSLVFTLISIVYFLALRKILYRYDAYSKGQEFSDDEFSILVEHIPPFFFDNGTTIEKANYNYKKSIQSTFTQYIEQWIETVLQKRYNTKNSKLEERYVEDVLENKKLKPDERDKKVTGVSVCYDLNQLENINAMRDQILEEETGRQVQTQIALLIMPDNLLSGISNRVTLLNHEYIRLCQNYTTTQNDISAFKLTHFTGKALVSFQFQHYKTYFLEKYEEDPQFFKISRHPIKMSHASKPNDIYWYNMKVSDGARNSNIMYSWGVLFMLLVLSLAALLGLQFWKMSISNIKATTLSSEIKTMGLSGLMSILTTLINVILSSSMELLSIMEKHKTKSERLRSLVFKTIVSQAVNTCFIYGIIHLIKPSFNILSSYGLVYQLVSLVIVSGVVTLLLQLFLPFAYLNKLINHYTIDKTQPIKMFQIQLNKKIQLPEFDFNQRYANYVIYTFVICFYGFLIPLATLALIGIFVLQYWVDKYNLFRRFSTPIDFSFELIEIVISMFQSSVLLFAVGNFLWDLSVHYDSTVGFRILTFITLAMAFVYTIFSYLTTHSFKRRFLQSQPKPCPTSYTYLFSKRNRSTKTYFNENPATFCLEDQRIFDYKVMYLLEAKEREHLDKELLGKVFNIPQYRSSSQSASILFKERQIQEEEAQLYQQQDELKTKINEANRQLKKLYQKAGIRDMTASRRLSSTENNLKEQKLRFELNQLNQKMFQTKMKLKDVRQKYEYNQAKKSSQAKGSDMVLKYLRKMILKKEASKYGRQEQGILNEQQLLSEARKEEQLQEQLYLKDEELANWEFPENMSIEIPKATKKDVQRFRNSGKK